MTIHPGNIPEFVYEKGFTPQECTPQVFRNNTGKIDFVNKPK